MSSRNIIFHLCYKPREELSGPNLRPQMLIDAFRQLGFTVDVISGYKKERAKQISAITKAIKMGKKYDFVYSEASARATLLTEQNHRPYLPPYVDFQFFKFLKKNGISLGLFYRDIYWKSPNYKKRLSFYKRIPAYFLYWLDLYYYAKFLDILFIPSLEMSRLLPKSLQKIAVEWLPGHAVQNIPPRLIPKNEKDIKLFYVGGVGAPYYDITPLLKVAKKGVNTLIYCRKNEWLSCESYQDELSPYVKIIHNKSLKELDDPYRNSNFFAILRNHDDYLNFAVPLKLFEAIGYCLPIITVGGTKLAELVMKNGIGWVLDDLNKINWQKLLLEYESKVNNLFIIRNQHSWIARAEFVSEKLS